MPCVTHWSEVRQAQDRGDCNHPGGEVRTTDGRLLLEEKTWRDVMFGGGGPHFVGLIEKSYVGALRRESWRLRPPRFSVKRPCEWATVGKGKG